MTYKIEKVRPGVSSKRKFEDEDPIPYEIRKVWAAERLHNSSRGIKTEAFYSANRNASESIQ